MSLGNPQTFGVLITRVIDGQTTHEVVVDGAPHTEQECFEFAHQLAAEELEPAAYRPVPLFWWSQVSTPVEPT